MWTFNSEGPGHLEESLRSIDAVLAVVARRKIAVDGGSSDNTIKMLKEHGWEVFQQEGVGIGSAVRQAFSLTETRFVISVESDVVLASNWLDVFKSMSTGVITANGIRYSNVRELRAVERFMFANLASRVTSIDNNIWDMDAFRSVGEFPVERFSSDWIFRQKAESMGYKWVVDHNIQSIHLRKDLEQELGHMWRQGREGCMLSPHPYRYTIRNAIRFLTSPVRGVQMAFGPDGKSPITVYPRMRWATLRGAIAGLKDIDSRKQR